MKPSFTTSGLEKSAGMKGAFVLTPPLVVVDAPVIGPPRTSVPLSLEDDLRSHPARPAPRTATTASRVTLFRQSVLVGNRAFISSCERLQSAQDSQSSCAESYVNGRQRRVKHLRRFEATER